MKLNFIIMLLLVAGLLPAQPPNSPIFNGGNNDGFDKAVYAPSSINLYNGGNGDGWSKAAFLQTAPNIFNGGNGDGSSTAIYLQAGNNIFNGGIGDGWHSGSFLQAGNNIFQGGEGDGWHSKNFLQAGNNIFQGGDGDGWSAKNYAQAANNIYNGGTGDGWASTYRPQGVLPVTFLSFDARKQGSATALLSWQTTREINAAYFNMERSTDAINFSFIGKVTALGSATATSSYSFTDQAPAKGLNYYRLQQVDKDGLFMYTPARVLRFDGLDAGAVKYYPNPTHGMLNLELTEAMKKEVKWITVSNELGMVLQQIRLQPSAALIIPVDFSKYPKGIYFIQVKTPGTNSTQRIVLR